MHLNSFFNQALKVFIFSLLLASCKSIVFVDDLEQTELIISKQIDGLEAIEENLDLVNGEEQELYSLALNEEKGSIPLPVRWSISDSTIVNLSSDESVSNVTLTPLQTGSVTLTVETLTLTKTFNLIVSAPPQDNIGVALSDEWVKVPSNAGGMSLPEFYVMKYEAKAWRDDNNDGVIQEGEGNKTHLKLANENYTPISSPDFIPWVGISANEASAKCRALGEGYDIISNREWQAILRDIETVDANWSQGSVGSGCLKKGGSNNGSECSWRTRKYDVILPNGTTVELDNLNWGNERDNNNKFILTNGNEVHDMTTSAGEWTDWDRDTVGFQGMPVKGGCETNLSFNNFQDISYSCSEINDEDFNSANGGYTIDQGVGDWMAYAGNSTTENAVIRGRRGSAFSFGFYWTKDHESYQAGFRCVYRP